MPDGCDFGSPACPPVVWSYPCVNFTLDSGVTEHVSIGPWFACDACSQLVEAGAWDELMRRVMERAETRYTHMAEPDRARLREVMRNHIEPWYAMFRQHRAGPREPITDVHRKDADALEQELREDGR